MQGGIQGKLVGPQAGTLQELGSTWMPSLAFTLTKIDGAYRWGTRRRLGHRPASEPCDFGDSGTDEDTIIDIITHRNNAQRQQIRQTFKSHFGRVRDSAWALYP